MLKKLATGSRKFFSAVGRIVLLAATCFLLGIGIVLPLWKWASSSPATYTWFVLGLICVGIIFAIVCAFKKKGPLATVFGLLKVLLIVGGLALAVYFVLNSNRILALIVLAVTVVLFCVLVSIKSAIEGHLKTKKL